MAVRPLSSSVGNESHVSVEGNGQMAGLCTSHDDGYGLHGHARGCGLGHA